MNLDDVIMPANKIEGIVCEPPLDHSKIFSALSKNEVFLKLENLQKTG